MNSRHVLRVTVLGLVLGSMGVPTAQAQLRRYDATTGQNVPVDGGKPSSQQDVPSAPPVPRGTQETPVVNNPQTSAEEPVPDDFGVADKMTVPGQAMGELYVFTTTRKITITALKAIHNLKAAVPDMQVKVYVDEQMPKDYFRMIARLRDHVKLTDEFISDSNGKLAAKFRVTEPNTIVYVAPNGTVRVYDLLSEMENALRQIQRVKKGG